MRSTRVFWFFPLLYLLSSMVVVSTGFDCAVFAQNGENVTVHFIDVGQGDSIFIDTSGLDVLVDGGTLTAGDTVVEYLGNLSITKIDLMVATHMDADHIGGLIKVLGSTIQVDEVLINNQTHDSVTYDDFISFATNHTFNSPERGDVYILTQTVNLTVLNPVQPLEFSEQNENSVVMRLQIGSSSFMLMGDAEDDTEASILQSGLEVESDVLKVGHHGSNSSTSDAFLNAVSPSIAIISAGLNNPYGHPHNETIGKLFARGITVYGTYKSGTIVATANSTTIDLPTNLQQVPEFPLAMVMTFLMIPLLIAVIIHRQRKNSTAQAEQMRPQS
jgi:competence protein ComEC